MCGEDIDPLLNFPDEMCATIDHVVRLYELPPEMTIEDWNDERFLASAHRRCNEDREVASKENNTCWTHEEWSKK